MQRYFKKIKERLERERDIHIRAYDVAIQTHERAGYASYARACDEAIAIVNQVAEEYGKDINVPGNDGWIPCSEKLPECEDYSETDALLFQLGSGTIEVGYFGKKNAWRDCYFRHYRGINGVDAKDVIAWQPLPAPYQPKGE